MKSGTIKKIKVLNRDRIAEVLPSFNAVNIDDANRLNPMMRNATANTSIPSMAIFITGSDPSAYSLARGLATGNTLIKVTTEISAMVFKPIL